MSSWSATAVVVDASALVEYLRQSDGADSVAAAIADNYAFAPAHLDAEVLSALRRLELRGEVDADRAQRAVADLLDFDAERVPVAGLAEEAWELRHNLTVHDGLYVVLARRLRAPLVTADRRLARAPDLGIELRIVAS